MCWRFEWVEDPNVSYEIPSGGASVLRQNSEWGIFGRGSLVLPFFPAEGSLILMAIKKRRDEAHFDFLIRYNLEGFSLLAFPRHCGLESAYPSHPPQWLAEVVREGLKHLPATSLERLLGPDPF